MSKLNEEVAVEVMGWEKREGDWGLTHWNGDAQVLLFDDVPGFDGTYHPDAWRPDQDRNQSRMVVKKAVEIVGKDDVACGLLSVAFDHIKPKQTVSITPYMLLDITPEQECQAALMAVREARK